MGAFLPFWPTFSVKSSYSIAGNFSPHSFPSRAIQLLLIPCRIAFFCWTVAWTRILTIENLRNSSFSWTDVACVSIQGNLLIISFFVVSLLLSFGIVSLACLRWHGLCQVMPSNFLAIGMLTVETQCLAVLHHSVSCGAFGRNLMKDCVRL